MSGWKREQGREARRPAQAPELLLFSRIRVRMSSSSSIPFKRGSGTGGSKFCGVDSNYWGNTRSSLRLKTRVRRVPGGQPPPVLLKSRQWASSALVSECEHLAGSGASSLSAQHVVFPVLDGLWSLSSLQAPLPKEAGKGRAFWFW